MEGIITAIKGLLEVMERMAGGKKRAQWIFYILLVIVLGLAAKPVWDNISYVISQISFASQLGVALASVIFLVVGFGALFAAVTLIAAFPAQFTRSMLDFGFRIRLSDTFVALLDILRKADQEGLNETQIHQLRMDTESLHSKWMRSKTNIFISWIVPAFFKKDTTKWKLVNINTESEEKK